MVCFIADILCLTEMLIILLNAKALFAPRKRNIYFETHGKDPVVLTLQNKKPGHDAIGKNELKQNEIELPCVMTLFSKISILFFYLVVYSMRFFFDSVITG